MKWKAIIAVVIAAVVLGAAALAVFGFWLPYRNAQSTMTQGQMELRVLDDGKLQLTWPQADGTDRYLLEVRETGDMEQPYVYYRVYTRENTWTLPPLPTDKELTISVRTVVDYRQLWQEKERISENELSISLSLVPPALQNMQWTADEETKTVTLTYTLGENEWCHLHWKDEGGVWQEVQDTDQTELTLTFGDQGEFPVPSFGKHIFFHGC